MSEVVIPIDAALTAQLQSSFDRGPINERGEHATFVEHFISRIRGGLKAYIYAREHPPPHFCVTRGGEKASFAVTDCSRLRGNKGLERYERNIRNWWSDHRESLIAAWNERRPSDCPVGPIPSGARPR